MSYVVGIDLGTTSTVAAVCRPGGAAQVVPLEGSATAVPSAVYLGADGTLLVGEAAQRRALSDPGHVVRDLTRRVGDATPVLIGRRPVAPEELAARFLARLVDDVARREGGVAARVAVTHPAGWGPHRMGALHAALAEQGLGSAMLVPEPVAAATGYAAGARIEPGATVGIYDLGGGRCDATVLRRERDGFVVVGAPEGVEQFGGADLDEVVLAHVRDALGPAWEALDPTDPDVLAAVADLRREATAAKEALSQDTEVLVPVALPGSRTQVRLGRAEFEEMIRPALTDTVEAVRRALDGAGTSPADLAALVLVGGSVRIPLVPQLLSEEFGRDVTVAPDPVGVVAVGAALVAAGVRRPVPSADARAGARPPVTGGRTPAPPAAAAPAPSARAVERPVVASPGPGTLPLAAAAGSPDGTEVLAVARPPKQARPFVATQATTSRPRRIAVLASAGAVALAVLGGVVAFGIERVGAGSEAGAVTPAAVDTSAPTPTVVVVPAETTAPKPAPPPPPPTRRGTRAAPTTSAPPPATTVPPATTKASAPPTETAPPPTTEPENGNGNGDDDAGAGDGSGGAEAGDGAGGEDNAAGAEGAEAAPAGAAAAAAAPTAPAAEEAPEG
jgi:molecular chaperone DnaK